MSRTHICNNQESFAGIAERLSNVITDSEWLVLERHLVYRESYSHIGGAYLGVASSRVRQIENNALEKIIEKLHQEIECFSVKLEQLLVEAGGLLSVDNCVGGFPDMSEPDFNILLAACQYREEIAGQRAMKFVLDVNACNIHLSDKDDQ